MPEIIAHGRCAILKAMASAPLSHIPIFASLDAAAQEGLLAAMTRQQVPAQEMVFWIGDPAGPLFVVDKGRVTITAPDERGDHMLLETLGPGGVFGEISFLDGGPRTATARALTAATLLVLPRESFHAFLRQRPDVSIGILEIMGARQRTSTATIRGLKNPNSVIAETTTVWQRVSDVIATVAASQAFTLTHITWFSTWIMMNVLAAVGVLPAGLGFDRYPFGLLTLIVSLEAIFLSIFVLVSQNRQSQRDRIRTDLDYQVNVKAHLEIIGIVQRLERIERAVTGKGVSP
jgi:CRP/FNR family transcriptional regulator, cyclic AMP receptor protein